MELENLLREWNCLDILPILNENMVTLDRLKYLTAQDIKDLIPLVGPRAEFREKLFNWKKNNANAEEPDSAAGMSVRKDLACDNESFFQHTINVSEFLENNDAGKAAITYFREHNCLLETHRSDIIRVIVDAVFGKDIRLNCVDFAKITDQIIEKFPTESKDYYFIPRGRRKNPGGKLYDKFHNMKTKRRKSGNSTNRPGTRTSSNTTVDLIKPENLASNIITKELLQTDVNESKIEEANRFVISEKWKDTFDMRRKELEKKIDPLEFLKQWPAYKAHWGYYLIQDDFRRLYPDKDDAIEDKWMDFRDKIEVYYEENIKDRCSRENFNDLKDIYCKNYANYTILTLLNSVLVPTARFKDPEGRAARRYSIFDGEECFTLHLTGIRSLTRKYQTYKMKFFDNKETAIPVIILVGNGKKRFEDFYVHFDGEVIQFNTYLRSVQACFQIFHVFNIPYPRVVQNAWMFIQKYFYGITTKRDTTSPSLAKLLNYLETAEATT